MIFPRDNLCYGCYYAFIYALEITESLFGGIFMYIWGWREQYLLTCGFDVPHEVQQQHIEAAKIATTTSAKDNTTIKAYS